MPRLVILNAGPDTAGCGIGLKRAFDKHASGWEARAICRQVVNFSYPTDIVWQRNTSPRESRHVMELVRQADVVHVMDAELALRPFRDVLAGKTVVVHHLGSYFRRDPEGVSASCQAYGAIEVTGSIDPTSPHITFLPITADLEAMAALRQARYRPSARIRIAHAPTDRALKSTETIMAVIRQLSERYPIDLDLIEGVSNRECLERKALADVFVDELTLGFGMNAIEAWAMGIPVVSGLVDLDARAQAFALWGQLPWVDATAATLEPVIERLVTDPDWRAILGQHGKGHAKRWHSERAVVERTLAVYERAGMRAAA